MNMRAVVDDLLLMMIMLPTLVITFMPMAILMLLLVLMIVCHQPLRHVIFEAPNASNEVQGGGLGDPKCVIGFRDGFCRPNPTLVQW